jgi:hypothetical protein
MTESAKTRVRDEVFLDRAEYHIIKNPVDINENKHCRNKDRNNGTYNVPPQRFEVVNERHFSLIIISIK